MTTKRTFKVYMHATASAIVPVTLRADELERLAEEYEVAVGDLTLDMLRDAIADKAYDNTPSVCAQCSGWGKADDEPSLELGDEWVMDDDDRAADAEGEFTDVVEITGESRQRY